MKKYKQRMYLSIKYDQWMFMRWFTE